MTKEKQAQEVFDTVCEALDQMNWNYDTNKDDKNELYKITFNVQGDDLTMGISIVIDTDRQIMYLKSQMPFSVSAKVRDTMALALIRANWSMLNGSFEMNYSSGAIYFKLIIPFMDSDIGVETCKYMFKVSCNMIDKFNDKFQDIATGRMTLQQLQEFIDKNDN